MIGLPEEFCLAINVNYPINSPDKFLIFIGNKPLAIL